MDYDKVIIKDFDALKSKLGSINFFKDKRYEFIYYLNNDLDKVKDIVNDFNSKCHFDLSIRMVENNNFVVLYYERVNKPSYNILNASVGHQNIAVDFSVRIYSKGNFSYSNHFWFVIKVWYYNNDLQVDFASRTLKEIGLFYHMPRDKLYYKYGHSFGEYNFDNNDWLKTNIKRVINDNFKLLGDQDV